MGQSHQGAGGQLHSPGNNSKSHAANLESQLAHFIYFMPGLIQHIILRHEYCIWFAKSRMLIISWYFLVLNGICSDFVRPYFLHQFAVRTLGPSSCTLFFVNITRKQHSSFGFFCCDQGWAGGGYTFTIAQWNFLRKVTKQTSSL